MASATLNVRYRCLPREDGGAETFQKVQEHRKDTNIKLDLLGRSLSATMHLAKGSVEYARVRKVLFGYSWCQTIHKVRMALPGYSRFEKITCLPQLLPEVPDLNDFIRAFNLIHDWYPKLHEQVRIHRKTWSDCNMQVLESMQKLVKADRVTGDKATFCAWAEAKLAENLEEQQRKEHEKAEGVLQEMKALLNRNVLRSECHPESQQVFREVLDKMVVQQDLETGDSTPAVDVGDALKQGCCSLGCTQDCCKELDDVRQNLQAMFALACGSEGNKSGGHWRLALKTPILRVMWIILMLDFFFMYQAGALGLLSQIFLELNVNMHKSDPLNYWPLILLPFAVIAYSICGTVLGNLVHGSFQYPPFQWARARFTIFLNPGILCGENLDKFQLQMIDWFFTDALLQSTVFFGFLFAFFPSFQGDDSWFDCFLNGLNTGALTWTSVCVVLTGLARWYCNIWLETFIIEQAHNEHLPFTWCGRSYVLHCLRQRLPNWIKFAKTEDIRNIVFRPTRCSSILMEAFQTYGILPGETSTYFLCLQRFLQIHWHDDQVWNVKQVAEWVMKENKSMDVKQNEGMDVEQNECVNLEQSESVNPQDRRKSSWEAYSRKLATWDSLLLVSHDKWGNISGFLSILAWICTVGVCIVGLKHTESRDSKCWVLIATTLAMTCTVFFLTIACEHSMPVLTAGKMFRIHGLIFVALIFFFIIFTKTMVGGPEGLSPLMTKNSTLENRGMFYNDGGNESLVTPYPACSMSWGRGQAKVGILDLAAMAYYAYAECKNHFAKLLNTSFDNVEIVKWSKFSDTPRVVAAKIGHNTTGPCTVMVAVKGTSNKLEMMIDVGVFSTVSVLQMLDMVAPLLGTVPMRVLTSIIDQLRLPWMKQTQKKWSQTLQTAVKELQDEYSNCSLVITGHSLGGNFAEMVGAQLHIPSVGFSAPGQFYMMKQFELGREAVAQNVMTVIPSMDVIPHVAKHVDTVQKILCRKPDGKFRSPHECHSIEATSCELWRVCGDQKRRDFSQKCLNVTKPLVNEKCIGQRFHHNMSAPCHLLSAAE